MPAELKPGDDFEYYRGDIYWNNFDQIISHIATSISGDASVWWTEYIKRKYGAFDTCFAVNCGNGWVERDLYRIGLIKRAIGFDISERLLDDARREAAQIAMPSEYRCVDSNALEEPVIECDFIINNGAMHHIAYIDRFTRFLYRTLPAHGVYAMFDYTGAHRNQYDWTGWSRALEVNEALPAKYRQDLRYPHMKTMLATDPTEAIHSELQLEVLERYFNIEDKVFLGGGVAYVLLYNNHRLHQEQHTPEGAAAITAIIEADTQLTREHPETNLTTFAVATPKRNALHDRKRLEAWSAEEEDREWRASQNGGRYYPPTALELIYETIYATQDARR